MIGRRFNQDKILFLGNKAGPCDEGLISFNTKVVYNSITEKYELLDKIGAVQAEPRQGRCYQGNNTAYLTNTYVVTDNELASAEISITVKTGASVSDMLFEKFSSTGQLVYVQLNAASVVVGYIGSGVRQYVSFAATIATGTIYRLEVKLNGVGILPTLKINDSSITAGTPSSSGLLPQYANKIYVGADVGIINFMRVSIRSLMVTMSDNTTHQWNCNEEKGSTALDSGTAVTKWDLTITNFTESLFHAVCPENLNPANTDGYAVSATGVIKSISRAGEGDTVHNGSIKLNMAITNGWCADFGDGTLNYCASQSNVELTGDIVAEAYINPVTTGGGNAGNIINNGKFLFWVSSPNRIRWSSDGASTIANSADNSVAMNEWSHIKIIRNHDGLSSCYINGVLSGDENQDSGTPVEGTLLYVGNRSTNDRRFDGKIECVRIHNSVQHEWKFTAGADTNIVDRNRTAAIDLTATNITESTFWSNTANQPYNFINGCDVWKRISDNKLLYYSFDLDGESIKTQGDTVTGYTWVTKLPSLKLSQYSDCYVKLYENPAQFNADTELFWFNADGTAKAKTTTELSNNTVVGDYSFNKLDKGLLMYDPAISGSCKDKTMKYLKLEE